MSMKAIFNVIYEWEIGMQEIGNILQIILMNLHFWGETVWELNILFLICDYFLNIQADFSDIFI